MNESSKQADYRQDTYAPYRKEAFDCLFVDGVIAISIILLLLLAGAGWFLLIILPLFAALTVPINYLTVLRARKELSEGAFERETVEITNVSTMLSAAGYGGSILREIYPKKLRAGRYRMVCRRADGERLVLFCVMSEEKGRLMREAIDGGQMKDVVVTFGSKSKIFTGFETDGGILQSLNRRF